MSKVIKEKDYVELSFRNKIGGKHAFDTEEEALDWAECRGYEPEEIKITRKEGEYLFDGTMWQTKEQAEAIMKIVSMYKHSFPEESLYAGEAYIIAKFLKAVEPKELHIIKNSVKEAFKEE